MESYFWATGGAGNGMTSPVVVNKWLSLMGLTLLTKRKLSALLSSLSSGAMR